MDDNIRTIQEQIVQEFRLLDDPFDQYAYLLELAARLPYIPQAQRDALQSIAGCQSHVWLSTRMENGLFVFDADSDTMLIRGMLYLLQRMLCHQPPAEVAVVSMDFLERSGIVTALSDDRRKGIGSVIRALQMEAKKYIE